MTGQPSRSGPSAAIATLLGVAPTKVRRLSGSGNDHWAISCGSEQYVLRRFGPSQNAASIAWEQRVIAHLARCGWPVADAIAGPAEIDGRTWMVMRRLAGRTMPTTTTTSFRRGQVLALLHQDLASLDVEQRPGWDRHDLAAREVPDISDELQIALAARFPGEAESLSARMAEFTRRTLEGLRAHPVDELPFSVVHGDLLPWNLLVVGSEVTAVLDFEKSHLDLQASDVAFATWGGRYVEVVAGYRSIARHASFTDEQLQLLWDSTCLAAIQRHLHLRRQGLPAGGLGWAVDHALRPWGA